MANLIAFAGYAREGKDAAATRLINLGWKRIAFGDIIKRQIGRASCRERVLYTV